VTYCFGDNFELDIGAYELRSAGKPVKLAPKSMDILLLLVDRCGQLVTREQIKKLLWRGDLSEVDRNLNMAIVAIRRALRESARQPRLLKTVHTRGYRFVAPVSIRSDEMAARSIHFDELDFSSREGTGLEATSSVTEESAYALSQNLCDPSEEL